MKYEFKETLLYVDNLCVAYDDNIIIKDINITYELMEGTNHVEVKVNYNFNTTTA